MPRSPLRCPAFTKFTQPDLHFYILLQTLTGRAAWTTRPAASQAGGGPKTSLAALASELAEQGHILCGTRPGVGAWPQVAKEGLWNLGLACVGPVAQRPALRAITRRLAGLVVDHAQVGAETKGELKSLTRGSSLADQDQTLRKTLCVK